jgi:hypothetical protein
MMVPGRRLTPSILALILWMHAGSSFAGFPDTTIDWMQGPPALNGQPTYTGVHAETRIKGFDPQVLQKSSALSEATGWQAIVPDIQPFRSTVDRENGMVYWRKDFFDKCPAAGGCNFYGEVFGFNDRFVYLRTESFPVFGGSIDDGKTWDIRIDKFRMVSNSNQGRDYFPEGLGRIWAPAHVENNWNITQTINTLGCLSFDAFTHGQCKPYQKNFVDNSVSLEVWSNFSTVFDGEAPGYPADPEYKTFDRAIVIVQVMGKGQARERFFLAGKLDKNTNEFRSYGFVRWDNSVRDATGKWVSVARTVGLKRAADKDVSFDGMRIRGGMDSFKAAAGLRIFHDDTASYPTDDQTKSCPGQLRSIGSMHLPSSTAAGKSELEDLSGYTSESGGWAGICYAADKTAVALTVPDGCPPKQQRGSLFAKEANVKRSMAGADSDLTTIKNGWVVLCAAKESDWHVYFSLAGKGCDSGGLKVGTVGKYKDCYDAKGRRCQADPAPDSMNLCAER